MKSLMWLTRPLSIAVREAKIDDLFDLCKNTIVTLNVPEEAELITAEMVSSIRNLLQTRRNYKKMMVNLASKQPAFKRLQTLIGVGEESAAMILGEVYDKIRNQVHQLIPMGRFPKMGSPILGHAIYMASEYARRHNPYLANLFAKG